MLPESTPGTWPRNVPISGRLRGDRETERCPDWSTPLSTVHSTHLSRHRNYRGGEKGPQGSGTKAVSTMCRMDPPRRRTIC
eukprot:3169730-Prymnesium_polylepis.1